MIEANDIYFKAQMNWLIKNLDFLKTLPVEDYHLYRKWDELRHYVPPYPKLVQEAKDLIWNPGGTQFNSHTNAESDPTILHLNSIKPKVIVVGESKIDEGNYRLWDTYRYFVSSAENNNVPGRMMKFLVIDDADAKKRVLGIAAVASDASAIGCRDKYIGWTRAQKDGGKLRCTAIASTVVPTQPFGYNFLGGKLIAALITTQIVRDEWHSRYGDILAGMTTTSLYGSPCIYDRIPWWKKLGYAKGSVPIMPDTDLYLGWRRWLAKNKLKEFENVTKVKGDRSGPPTGEKLKMLNLIFKTIGMSSQSLRHGFRRGVYFSSFYKNTREFLCGTVPKDKLIPEPRFQGDVTEILNWWKPIAIRRYNRLKQENRLRETAPWYADMGGMDYVTAKKTYSRYVGG